LQTLGLFAQIFNQLLMTAMDAVKVSNSQHAAFVARPKIVQAGDDFHTPSIGAFGLA
jgi:hypothetical protein